MKNLITLLTLFCTISSFAGVGDNVGGAKATQIKKDLKKAQLYSPTTSWKELLNNSRIRIESEKTYFFTPNEIHALPLYQVCKTDNNLRSKNKVTLTTFVKQSKDNTDIVYKDTYLTIPQSYFGQDTHGQQVFVSYPLESTAQVYKIDKDDKEVFIFEKPFSVEDCAK